MWLEVKAILSVVAFIFIAVVLSQILFLNMLLSMLLFFAIGMVFFGDMLIGYQITKNHLKPLMDPTPANKELCILFTIGGMIDFINTTKGSLGKREFVYHKQEASVINDGKYPIRMINGNHGFVGHESYDKNVNLYKARALEQMSGDDIKEIYYNAIEKQKGDAL